MSQAWNGTNHNIKKNIEKNNNNINNNNTNSSQHQHQHQHQQYQQGGEEQKAPIGLQNLHNTCYFNSVLQCLIQIQPLTAYFSSSSVSTTTTTTTFPSYSLEKETILKNKNASNSNNNGTNNGLVDIDSVDMTIASSYASFLNSIQSKSYGNNNGNNGDNNHNNNKAIIVPIQLLQTVKKCITIFNNYNQHDPHEFCSFFLNSLHEDLNRCSSSLDHTLNLNSRLKLNSSSNSNNNNNSNKNQDHNSRNSHNNNDHHNQMSNSIQFWKQHVQNNDSTIVDNFQGLLQNNIHCPQCSYSSTTFDIYSMLSLPLPSLPSLSSSGTSGTSGTSSSTSASTTSTTTTTSTSTLSIEQCINEFNKSHILDDYNTWYCPKCKQHVNARQSIKIWTCPNVLIFHLKRFSTNMGTGTNDVSANNGNSNGNKKKNHRSQETKNIQKISFPIDTKLDMKPFITPNGPMMNSNTSYNNDSTFEYKLIGVCNHEGPSVHRGHYTSIIRNQNDNEWYKCNDSKVESVHYTNNNSNSRNNNNINSNSSDNTTNNRKYNNYKNDNTSARTNKNSNLNNTPYLLFYQRSSDNCNYDSGISGESSSNNNNSMNDMELHLDMKWGGMNQIINGRRRKKKVKPQVDDDGFTMVASKKKNKKR